MFNESLSSAERMMYNPGEVGKKGTIFGLPYSLEEADLVLLPVPCDVTASYIDGTSNAPALILDESTQLDLSISGYHQPWNCKIVFSPDFLSIHKNKYYRQKALCVIEAIENGHEVETDTIDEINTYCEGLKQLIYQEVADQLNRGKIVGLVGGDHSSPLGLLEALAERTTDFGILQLDAHMDLRRAYEGFTLSHASIMCHALALKEVSRLIQVGIRDFCEEELEFIRKSEKKIITYFDETLFHRLGHNESWYEIADEIIDLLPYNVYISFDVDSLDPALCPATGTPVPGGLHFNQVVVLMNKLAKSGKKIIGFDLCETGNARWDANVAARILYRLCIASGFSNKLL